MGKKKASGEGVELVSRAVAVRVVVDGAVVEVEARSEQVVAARGGSVETVSVERVGAGSVAGRRQVSWVPFTWVPRATTGGLVWRASRRVIIEAVRVALALPTIVWSVSAAARSAMAGSHGLGPRGYAPSPLTGTTTTTTRKALTR